jgi:protein O-GlcNAc transferase
MNRRSPCDQALNNRGNTLQALKRFEDALASYEQALAVQSNYAEALNNRGNALWEVKRFGVALASYDEALAARPDDATTLDKRGVLLHELKRFDEAPASYEQALAVRPDFAEALNNRGKALVEVKRFGEALGTYEKAISLEPDHKHVLSGLASCAIKVCDWTRREKVASEVCRRASEPNFIVPPFLLLGYSGGPLLHLLCAKKYVHEQVFISSRSLWRGAIWRNERIKVAYVSADFRSHTTAHLMAELVKLHDRSKFEVIGISFGPDDGSQMRACLIAAFDQFFNVRTKSDHEVARLLYDLRIDIAVDLQGHHRYARPGILASRPAPLQVNFAIYPGTMGANFIDYIIADAVVLPLDRQQHFTEKIVHLPECYQVNDRKYVAATRTPSQGRGRVTGGGVRVLLQQQLEDHVISFRRLDATIGGARWQRALAAERQ